MSHATPQLPARARFIVKHTYSFPEGWPKTYIVDDHTSAILAITGEGDTLSYELSTMERPNEYTTINIFPRCAVHQDAVGWVKEQIIIGESHATTERIAA